MTYTLEDVYKYIKSLGKYEVYSSWGSIFIDVVNTCNVLVRVLVYIEQDQVVTDLFIKAKNSLATHSFMLATALRDNIHERFPT